MKKIKKVIEIGKPGQTIYEKKIIEVMVPEDDTMESQDIFKELDGLPDEPPLLEDNEKVVQTTIEDPVFGIFKSGKTKKERIKDLTDLVVSAVKAKEAEDIKEEKVEKVVVKRGPTDKPSILLISDVKNWAWWNKMKYLEEYLSDDFDFELIYALGEGKGRVDVDKHDLYLTFGWTYVPMLRGVPRKKRISGVTAHRAAKVIKPRMAEVEHIHANSMMLLAELQAMGLKNLYYLPNGVDERLFRPVFEIPPKREKIIVGHVGKECPAKGQIEFIKPAIKQAEAESLINVKNYTDQLPFNEMWKMYQEMDVFIVASTEDGTPNPALEAAACGRPIISNRIGNMPEFIKDGYNGFLIDKRNVDEYTDRIEYLQKNRDVLIEMGKNARKTVLEGWTWKYQTQNYKNMFNHILEKR